jgi:hypothetical protein
VSTPNQPLGLDDPGVRLRLIREVWDNSTAPIWFRHLDADAPVLLRDQPINRIDHVEHFSWLVLNRYRPVRVPPLAMVVIQPRSPPESRQRAILSVLAVVVLQ